MLIENSSDESSDVTPVIEIRLEQNHLVADGGMEGTDELHHNDDTQKIRRMMQETSRDPIPSVRGIDVLKIKSIVSEVNDIICNISVENSDELKNLLRAGARLVCGQRRCYCQQKRIQRTILEKAN